MEAGLIRPQGFKDQLTRCSPVQNQPDLQSLGWLRVGIPSDWELNFAPTDWELMDELKKAWLSYIKEVSSIWKITLLSSLIFWYFYKR